MGQKDIAEKLLEDYNDVFADIANVLLFNGKRVIREESLKETKNRSQYKADDRQLHEQERDVSKYWMKTNIRLAEIGYENQSGYDKYMPVRIIGYDGAAYRSQLLDGHANVNQKQPVFPVVTIVLNFSNQRWGKSKSLHDCIDIPNELKPYVSDYKILVFDIAYLTKEQINLFQSDFFHLAEYCYQRRTIKDYHPSRKTINHVDALLKMFTVLTGDQRYEDSFEALQTDIIKGGNIAMCEVLDRIEKRGYERGEKRSIEKIVINMYNKGFSLDQISEIAEINPTEVNEILSKKNISSV